MPNVAVPDIQESYVQAVSISSEKISKDEVGMNNSPPNKNNTILDIIKRTGFKYVEELEN